MGCQFLQSDDTASFRHSKACVQVSVRCCTCCTPPSINRMEQVNQRSGGLERGLLARVRPPQPARRQQHQQFDRVHEGAPSGKKDVHADRQSYHHEMAGGKLRKVGAVPQLGGRPQLNATQELGIHAIVQAIGAAVKGESRRKAFAEHMAGI